MKSRAHLQLARSTDHEIDRPHAEISRQSDRYLMTSCWIVDPRDGDHDRSGGKVGKELARRRRKARLGDLARRRVGRRCSRGCQKADSVRRSLPVPLGAQEHRIARHRRAGQRIEPSLGGFGLAQRAPMHGLGDNHVGQSIEVVGEGRFQVLQLRAVGGPEGGERAVDELETIKDADARRLRRRTALRRSAFGRRHIHEREHPAKIERQPAQLVVVQPAFAAQAQRLFQSEALLEHVQEGEGTPDAARAQIDLERAVGFVTQIGRPQNSRRRRLSHAGCLDESVGRTCHGGGAQLAEKPEIAGVQSRCSWLGACA